MIDRTKRALQRLAWTYRRDGLFFFIRVLRYYIFPTYDDYYLYEHTMATRTEAGFLPRLQNFTCHVVSSNKQADMLAADGVDFREYVFNARWALDKGAIAFCIFIGGEFAHIGWVALTEEAKNTFDIIPYKVDFADREACTGGTMTVPKFRGKGLMKYGYFMRFQFLFEKGIRISRNAVASNNIASQRVHALFHPRILGKYRFVKFLKWGLLYRIAADGQH